jgi:hypothetical protein
MDLWRSALRGDPVSWLLERDDPGCWSATIRVVGARRSGLLERDDPAVRHLALVALLIDPEDAANEYRTAAGSRPTWTARGRRARG